MKLYHGTSSKHLPSILAHGLRPRARRIGNWSHLPSSKDHIYLTTTYAMHYACAATPQRRGQGVWDNLIVEVDMDELEEGDFFPDEDFLHQATKHNFAGPEFITSAQQRTTWYRDNLANFHAAWKGSLKYLGTIAHRGRIPVSAITRIAIVPRHHPITLKSDPTVTLMNHKIMSKYYQAYMAYIFGDKYSDACPLNKDRIRGLREVTREGIEIIVP